MRSLLNRRVGWIGFFVIVAVGVAVTAAIVQVVPKKGDDEETAAATPTATACQELDPPYGTAPDGFVYEPVPESKRAQTVTALKLDESEGKVDVREAKQNSSGLSLGSIVGVPSQTPSDYASRLVASVQTGGSKVESGNGFAIVPLASGTQVAVGVKGCRTVLVSAQDPNATRFLATAIFSE